MVRRVKEKGQLSERVSEFEKENNTLMYHVINSYTNIGEMGTYLFVSDYCDEWQMDNEGIPHG